MTDITPILPIQTVSNYTRTAYVGDNIQTSQIQYVKTGDGTPQRVEQVYTTYNVRGEIEQPRKPEGTILDVMI